MLKAVLAESRSPDERALSRSFQACCISFMLLLELLPFAPRRLSRLLVEIALTDIAVPLI